MTPRCEYRIKGKQCGGRAMHGHRYCGPHVDMVPRADTVRTVRIVRTSKASKVLHNQECASTDTGPWYFATALERDAWLLSRQRAKP